MHWKAAEKVAVGLTMFVAVTVLAVALGSSVARLWFSETQPIAPIVLPSANNTVAIATPSADLFGVEPIETQSLQPTTLKISLLGVLPSATPDQGMAVIRSANKVEQAYQVGQSPVAGVTLKAVYDDHVILERNGQMETLSFGPQTDAQDPLFLPTQSAQGEASDSSSKQRVTAVAPLAPSEQSLEQFASAFRANPQQMLQDSGVLQIDNTYQLTADSRLVQFGLQPGDQLLSVNGMTLDALQRDAQLQAQLQQVDVIRAEIKRGGQRLIINFSIK